MLDNLVLLSDMSEFQRTFWLITMAIYYANILAEIENDHCSGQNFMQDNAYDDTKRKLNDKEFAGDINNEITD